MVEQKYRTGRCLCGAVKFKTNDAHISVTACHCSMCKHWSGGPFMAVDCGSQVKFEGQENISIYNSSEWAERGFCSQCGSNLFYRLKGTNQHQIPPGLFDDDDGLVFDLQVFIDQRPEYYKFANETNELTAAEVFAMYAPPPD